jgi:hypothetical protein
MWPKDTMVKVTLLDTNGFDKDCKSLPNAMLRNVDVVLWLIPADKPDYYAVQWCKEACTHCCYTNLLLGQGTESSVLMKVIGTKADLILKSKLVTNAHCTKEDIVWTHHQTRMGEVSENSSIFQDTERYLFEAGALLNKLHYQTSSNKQQCKVLESLQNRCKEIKENIRVISCLDEKDVTSMVYIAVAAILDDCYHHLKDTEEGCVDFRMVNMPEVGSTYHFSGDTTAMSTTTVCGDDSIRQRTRKTNESHDRNLRRHRHRGATTNQNIKLTEKNTKVNTEITGSDCCF